MYVANSYLATLNIMLPRYRQDVDKNIVYLTFYVGINVPNFRYYLSGREGANK